MLPGCLEIRLSVSVNLLHTLSVVTKMSSLQLTNFWNLVNTHILNMNIILKKTNFLNSLTNFFYKLTLILSYFMPKFVKIECHLHG